MIGFLCYTVQGLNELGDSLYVMCLKDVKTNTLNSLPRCIDQIGELQGRNSDRRFFSLKQKWDLPWIIGGDFISYASLMNEKGVGDGDGHDYLHFNNVINQAKFLDIPLTDHCLTWTNLQNRPILANLDRVLVSYDWETHFLLSILHSLLRSTSDHAPVSWHQGVSDRQTKDLSL